MSNKKHYLCIGGCCLTLGKLHLDKNNNRVFWVKICVDQGTLAQGGMFFKVFEVYMSLFLILIQIKLKEQGYSRTKEY